MGEEAVVKGSGTGRSPEEIRAEIEQTRAELSETVNTLKERLSPDHLKRQMVEKVCSATVGRAKKMVETSTEKAKEVGSSVAGTVRKNVVTKTILDNPIPAVLAGIGVAWLIWRKTGKSDGRAETFAGTRTGGREYGSRTRERSEEAIGEAGSKAKEVIGQARDRAEEAVGQAREKAGQLGTATREKARVWKERSRGILPERPVLLAGAALAAGLIIGFGLPGTERERKWMGRMKDELLSRARGFTKEKCEQAAHIAGDRPGSPRGQGTEEGLNL
jgi:ElaB/YqjD/DUF883 family membrane-anchored ribosome-binding protein